MKTISANPDLIETLSSWIAANHIAAIIAGAVLLMAVCMDGKTLRAFLPF